MNKSDMLCQNNFNLTMNLFIGRDNIVFFKGDFHVVNYYFNCSHRDPDWLVRFRRVTPVRVTPFLVICMATVAWMVFFENYRR